MSFELFVKALVSLLPVLIFLLTLFYLDSFKLLRLRTILWVIAAGCAMAVAAYFVNGELLMLLKPDLRVFSRFGAPIVEECLKAAVLLLLFRMNRIGFLVDAAILGFAAGAGFAIFENLYYLYKLGNMQISVWILRGFGTAVMHGGVTAIFAVLAQAMTERSTRANPLLFLPGLIAAMSLHSLFNHFPITPALAPLATLVLLPAILFWVFHKSSEIMHVWLEVDFDEDEQVLDLIRQGQFTSSKAGQFLLDLRERFDGPVVADMLCYIRVHSELAIRAKSILMAREFDMEVRIDQETRNKFNELRALQESIGKTGFLAMKPYLHMSRKDLWQLYTLQN